MSSIPLNSNPHASVKFRPVLSLQLLTRIASLVSNSDNPDDIAIKRVVVPMIAKVETGAISPAYKLSETHQKKQSETARRQRYESGEMAQQEELDYESEILGL